MSATRNIPACLPWATRVPVSRSSAWSRGLYRSRAAAAGLVWTEMAQPDTARRQLCCPSHAPVSCTDAKTRLVLGDRLFSSPEVIGRPVSRLPRQCSKDAGPISAATVAPLPERACSILQARMLPACVTEGIRAKGGDLMGKYAFACFRSEYEQAFIRKKPTPFTQRRKL